MQIWWNEDNQERLVEYFLSIKLRDTEKKEGDPGLRELMTESGFMWIWTQEAGRASERVVRKGESHTLVRELGIQAQFPGPSDITEEKKR